MCVCVCVRVCKIVLRAEFICIGSSAIHFFRTKHVHDFDSRPTRKIKQHRYFKFLKPTVYAIVSNWIETINSSSIKRYCCIEQTSLNETFYSRYYRLDVSCVIIVSTPDLYRGIRYNYAIDINEEVGRMLKKKNRFYQPFLCLLKGRCWVFEIIPHSGPFRLHPPMPQHAAEFNLWTVNRCIYMLYVYVI